MESGVGLPLPWDDPMEVCSFSAASVEALLHVVDGREARERGLLAVKSTMFGLPGGYWPVEVGVMVRAVIKEGVS